MSSRANLGSERIDRVVGDAPSIGQIERVGGSGRAQRKRRRAGKPSARKQRYRRRQWRRRVIMVWSAVFAVVVCLVLGAALWVWGKAEMQRSAVISEQQFVAPVIEKRIVSRFESPSREAALDLVKQALLIRDPAKVAEFFRVGDASPGEVVGFLQNLEQVDGAVTGYRWLSSMDANGLLLDGVSIISKRMGVEHRRLVLLTPDDSGKWQIDFAAFTRAVSPAWSALSTMAFAGHGVARVVFTKDNYYNGPFREEARWACFRLGSPDLTNDLLGYCRKDSPQAEAMARMLAHPRGTLQRSTQYRATLELRRVVEADSRQFEITRVLAEDWVLSTTPFDQPHK